MKPARLLLVAGLAAGALHTAGASSLLAGPPATWSGLLAWVDATPPPVAALALVRLIGEATAIYVIAVTAATTAGRAWRAPLLLDLAHRLAVPSLRRALHVSAGAGLAVGMTVPSAGAQPPPQPTPAASHEGADAEAVAIIRPHTSTARMSVEPSTASPSDALPERVYVVERGDSFWSIAEDLRDASGLDAHGPNAIDQIWRALIEANRHRLVDPGNPNLLHPGQVLVIPRAA